MKIITNNILNGLFHFLADTENFIFFDTSKPDSLNRRSLLFLHPQERIRYRQGEDEVAFLEKVQKLQRQGCYIAGWFSYEFGYLLEPTLRKRLQRPTDNDSLLADVGVFTSCHSFDHATGETDFPIKTLDGKDPAAFSVDNLRASQSEQDYKKALQKILAYIEAGDTYQVNYTLKLLFDFCGSADAFYQALRRNQSVSYGAYIRWNDQHVMSFSPELFFWKKGGDVIVRPMKGTMKRGKTPEEDNHYRSFLRSDIKNKSENVMIVDLLRNDLGRLMHHTSNGSVQVESLFDVETYETLLQMTSTITGKAHRHALDNISLHTFLKAIFPCGSVTGAPKIRTMEIIDELEKDRRGVYTGAIGYMLPDGDAVFNVPIRTVVIDGNRGEMGIGSGIVHDSEPQQEWLECLLKGRFLTEPQKEFQIIETMLWLPQSGYLFLKQHLDRLHDSSTYFLFQCDREKIENELAMLADYFDSHPRRVRLLLSKDGRYSIETAECDEPVSLRFDLNYTTSEGKLPKVGLSKSRTDSQSLWYFHKTTNRELYTTEYQKAVKQGYVDMIFQNENGHITEGCISNIFMVKDGRILTPSLSDGVLAGVMRNSVMQNEELNVVECSLTLDDLASAERIYICNSVRGIMEAELETALL